MKEIGWIRIGRIASAALVMVLLAPASHAHASEWTWELTPYLWTPSIGVDVSVNDNQIASTTVDFTDIIDKVDIAGLVHFEGAGEHWGFFVELDAFDISDDTTLNGKPLIPDGTEVAAEQSLLLAETGGIYRIFGDGSHGLDVLFGARVFDTSVDLDFDFPAIADRSADLDDTLVDGFAGLRYRGKIGGRWGWWIRGDAGTGDTDLSWQGVAGFGVGFGAERQNALVFGYRHYVFETENDDENLREAEFEFSGPMIGFKFGF